MRSYLRYLFIATILFTLTVLLLPARSAQLKAATASGGSRSSDFSQLGRRFLLANFAVADAGYTDLGVAKSVDSKPAGAGSNLTYTVIVFNYGPDNADSATLNDPLPTGTTFMSLTAPPGWSCSTPAVGAG